MTVGEPSAAPRRFEPFSLVTAAALFSAVLGLVAAALDRWLEAVDLTRALTLPAGGAPLVAAGLAAGVAAGLACTLLLAYAPPFRRTVDALRSVADWERFTVGHLAALAAVASLGEEILFRGALQPLVGAWAQGLLFGLAHWTSPAHALLAGALGVALGLGTAHAANLWPAIAAHFAIDLVTGLAARAALRRGSRRGR